MKLIQDHGWLRKLSMGLVDIALIGICIYLSMELRFEMAVPVNHALTMLDSVPLIVLVYMFVYSVGGIYKIMWRYAGVRDVMRLTVLSGIACLMTLALNSFMELGLFRGVLVYIGTLSVIGVGGIRMLP